MFIRKTAILTALSLTLVLPGMGMAQSLTSNGSQKDLHEDPFAKALEAAAKGGVESDDVATGIESLQLNQDPNALALEAAAKGAAAAQTGTKSVQQRCQEAGGIFLPDAQAPMSCIDTSGAPLIL